MLERVKLGVWRGGVPGDVCAKEGKQEVSERPWIRKASMMECARYDQMPSPSPCVLNLPRDECGLNDHASEPAPEQHLRMNQPRSQTGHRLNSRG